MEKKKKMRKSGIELLRILTAIGVIMLHYNDGRAFKYVQVGGGNQYLLFFLESCCICAVDLFVLISGYFLCVTQQRSLSKILGLCVQVIIFKEVIYLVSVILGKDLFSVRTFVGQMIPHNYFITLYAALYIISPYINLLLQRLGEKKLKRFLFTMLLLFSVWPTIVDFSGEVFNIEWFGFSTIGAWGNQQGFNIVNFVLLYLVGAYIRLRNVQVQNWRRWVGGVALLICVIFAWSVGNEYLSLFGLRSAWVYHNPLVIAMAALLFILFKDLNFSSHIVNELAGAAFTCFLFHGCLLEYIGIQKAVSGSLIKMILHIVLVLPGLYLLSYIVYKTYDYTVGRIWRKVGMYIDRKVKISVWEDESSSGV